MAERAGRGIPRVRERFFPPFRNASVERLEVVQSHVDFPADNQMGGQVRSGLELEGE